MDEDDTRIARPTAIYPPPDMTSSEFEEFVTDLLRAASPAVNDLKVTLHEKITGSDGTYDFDATVRYQFAGMSFLVLVEAKFHRNPIKRELVQVLHQKVQSVGGHKGFMVSTAPYQSGALTYAINHGIALATVTEGRFLYETRDVTGHQISREAAAKRGIPLFVGVCYGPGGEPGSTQVWPLAADDSKYPRHVAESVLGLPGG